MTPTRTVLMVTNNYFPYQSGVAQSVHVSTQALMSCGYKVVIVTLDIAKAHDDPDYVMRVPSVLQMQFKKNPIALSWRPDAYLKKIVDDLRPDIIHAHHPWLLGHSVFKAARAVRCPLVFTHHTMYQAYAHYVPLPQPVTSFFIKQRVRSYCAQVDHIIAPSQAVAQTILLQENAAAVSVIPSPIRACFFSAKKPYRQATQPLKLVYVGRFVQEKNIQAMLDAVALLPAQTYELDCVGYGQLWHELQQYAYKKCALNPRHVRFHHKPDEASLVAWYRQADLFLFPSLSDTQGLVLAESMACGTPVIALDGPGQRSIVSNGHNGYIVATSRQMADKILFIARHAQHLKHLSDAARITARDYTIETHAQRLTSVYESVIEQKKRGSVFT